jgi:hypothetical protein
VAIANQRWTNVNAMPGEVADGIEVPDQHGGLVPGAEGAHGVAERHDRRRDGDEHADAFIAYVAGLLGDFDR